MQAQESPLVSIIVTNYNYARFLPSALESALQQNYPKIEVILVDDGSTDDSLACVEPFSDRIKLIAKQNGGQASAFNAGFVASSGEVVCLLDSDDLFEHNKATRIVEALASEPQAGWVFNQLAVFRQGETPSPAAEGTTQPLQIPWGYSDQRVPLAAGVLPYVPTATSGMAFRRELLSRVLPMPEAKTVTTSDNYIKLCCLAFAPGLMLQDTVSLQRLHDNNAYTHAREGKALLKQLILIRKGMALCEKAPELQRAGERVLGNALYDLDQLYGADPSLRKDLRRFFRNTPMLLSLRIAARALLRRVRGGREQGGAPAAA